MPPEHNLPQASMSRPETLVSETQTHAKLARENMEQGMSASEAAKAAGAVTGFKKGEIYKLMMQ